MKTKIENVEILAKTNYVSLYDVEYTNKEGNKNNWAVSSRKSLETLKETYLNNKEDKVDAVVIVAFHKTYEKLVIAKQFRVPINKFIYELPAGLIDNNEEIEVSVKRELKEETGLDLIKIKNKVDKVYLSPGMTDESVSLVFCTCDGELSDKFLEEDEEIEALLLSQEDAKEIIKNNEILDIKAYLIINLFANMGKDFMNLYTDK